MEPFGGRAGRGDETGQQEVEGWEEIDEKSPEEPVRDGAGERRS